MNIRCLTCLEELPLFDHLIEDDIFFCSEECRETYLKIRDEEDECYWEECPLYPETRVYFHGLMFCGADHASLWWHSYTAVITSQNGQAKPGGQDEV